MSYRLLLYIVKKLKKRASCILLNFPKSFIFLCTSCKVAKNGTYSKYSP